MSKGISMLLKLLKGFSILLLVFIAIVWMTFFSYNPYHFEEYRISGINLDGTTVSKGSDRKSVNVDSMSVSANIYTNEWETWETEKLGSPYRIVLGFEQGCQDPEKWYSEVEVTRVQIVQENEKITLDMFPQRLTFKERPTVPGTPRQYGAGLMLDEKQDLNFYKNAVIELAFLAPSDGSEHIARFEFEPLLRKGLFRANFY